MKKLSLLPAAIVGIMGIGFAAMTIFPNTNPDFPQLPISDGTIGGFLSNYFDMTDGTAKNTAMFYGYGPNTFLQDNDCNNPINTVWIGVDANGRGICGSTDTSLLGYLTDYTGSTVEIYHGGSWSTVASVGLPISVGDFIKTGNDSLATVVFSDSSVIRLNTGSKIDFGLGVNEGGQTVAQVILNYGETWGRVMTSTGINFGNEDWIAGVRGTAITMSYRNIGTKLAPVWTGSINIIDSTMGPGIAAVVESRVNPAVTTNLVAGSAITMKNPESLPSYTKNITTGVESFSSVTSAVADTNTQKFVTPRVTSLVSPWVRENIKKDLVYLGNLSNSGTVAPAIQAKAKDEFIASIPKDPNECTRTLFGNIVTNDQSGKSAVRSKRAKMIPSSTALVATNFCNDILLSSNTIDQKVNKTTCALGSLAYFGGSNPDEYCEKKGIVAVAEYNQKSTIEDTLGMYTSTGTNLFNYQETLNYTLTGSPNKYVPYIINGLFIDGDTGGQPLNASKLSFLDIAGLKFQSGALQHAIFTMTDLDNLQGVYINNQGSNTYVRYLFPNNINKIEIAVRGASLLRDTGTKYYLFGIDNGFQLYTQKTLLGKKIILKGLDNKELSINVPTDVYGKKDKFFTVVFKKDALTNQGTLFLEDDKGNPVPGSSIVTDDVGVMGPYFTGSPYIYIGTDDEGEDAINDIIDFVRLYSE